MTPRTPSSTWLVRALVAGIVLASGVLVWQVTRGGDDDDARPSTPARTSPDTVDSTSPETLPTAPSTSAATTSTTVAPTTVVPTTVGPTTVVPTTAGPTPVVFASRCESSVYGWDVGVPQGWFTDEVNDVWACAGFDRVPVVIDDEVEVILPLAIWFIEANAAEVLAGYGEGSFAEVVSDVSTTAGSYDARRLETVAGFESQLEQGTRGIAVVIDRGGWSTVVIEGFGWTDAEYAEVVAIVDAMTADIRFWDS